MDSIDIKGQNYISSKRAAELTGYAQDYIGQLARGGKVPATRVGRSWYVSEKDILNHAGKTELLEPKEEAEKPRIKLEDKPKLKTLQSLREGRNVNFKTWSSVKYLDDNSDLIPSGFIKKVSDNISGVDVKKVESKLVEEVPQVLNIKSDVFDGVSNKKPSKKHLQVKVETLVPQKRSYALAGSLVAVHLIIALFPVLGGVILSGAAVSSEWIVSTSQISTAFGADFSLVFEFFNYIFSETWHLITSALSFFVSSMGTFLSEGINFFKGLINIG